MGFRKSAVAVVGLTCLLAVVLCAGCSSRDSSQPVPGRSAKPDASATAYSDYLGYWCDSGNAANSKVSQEGMSEIAVSSAGAGSITFTVQHTGPAPSYRITGSETTITAAIVDGKADFEFRDDRGSANSGKIQFLDGKLVVEIRQTAAAPSANGSLAMDCLMLRDRYHDTRTVLEPVYGGAFIGVVGVYSRASEPSEVPSINIVSVSNGHVVLDLTGTFNDKVYYEHLDGRITGKSEVEVRLETEGVTLLLRWQDPGTIVVVPVEGHPSGVLQLLIESPTYWNSEYLHTS
jgi:hypothetical protein